MVETLQLREVQKRDLWAAERFEDLGFTPEIALHLAMARVDWHRAEKMISQGCSLAHVLRILL